MATSKYTYIDFANDAKALANGEKVENVARFIEKADALIATQTSKADYNKAHPKASAAKGASEDTKAKAAQIRAILSDNPLTASEINAVLGTEYTALQVANAVKFIEGAQSQKVVRSVKNAKGLTSEKEYTAYTI